MCFILDGNQYGMVDSGLASVGLGNVGLVPFDVVATGLANVWVCGSAYGGLGFGSF